jgi:hypothetical protein
MNTPISSRSSDPSIAVPCAVEPTTPCRISFSRAIWRVSIRTHMPRAQRRRNVCSTKNNAQIAVRWSEWLDSNQRPPGPKPGALTKLRYTQTMERVTRIELASERWQCAALPLSYTPASTRVRRVSGWVTETRQARQRSPNAGRHDRARRGLRRQCDDRGGNICCGGARRQ